MDFVYRFNAIQGLQANSTYYVAMVPVKLLPKIFVTETEETLPEYRAQRKINTNRIPEIKKYILTNRDSYVFSAIAASINGSYKFIPYNNLGIGILEVDMNAVFLINDGQHRKAALEEAILEDSSLENETISVVFYEDQGLQKSQQMFSDLNKHAVNTSKSLNTLYDSKNQISVFTKEMVKRTPFINAYTDKEKDTLGKYSKMLFTLNNFYVANEKLFSGMDLSDHLIRFGYQFWGFIAESIFEWNELVSKQITKKSLREDFIITQGVVLLAFGKLGNFIYKNKIEDYPKYIKNLESINWLRSNPIWNGRTLIDGKINRKEKSVNLTYIKIKELIGISLTNDEIILNRV